MRKRVLDVICCPICKADFELVAEKIEVIEVNEEKEEDVKEGKLICKNCREEYPIKDGIAILLPPELREKVLGD